MNKLVELRKWYEIEVVGFASYHKYHVYENKDSKAIEAFDTVVAYEKLMLKLFGSSDVEVIALNRHKSDHTFKRLVEEYIQR